MHGGQGERRHRMRPSPLTFISEIRPDHAAKSALMLEDSPSFPFECPSHLNVRISIGSSFASSQGKKTHTFIDRLSQYLHTSMRIAFDIEFETTFAFHTTLACRICEGGPNLNNCVVEEVKSHEPGNLVLEFVLKKSVGLPGMWDECNVFSTKLSDSIFGVEGFESRFLFTLVEFIRNVVKRFVWVGRRQLSLHWPYQRSRDADQAIQSRLLPSLPPIQNTSEECM